MARVYDRTGQPVDLPDEQLGDAIASGQYGLPQGDQVPVVLKDGRRGSVGADNFLQALSKGARVETAAEREEIRKEQEYGEGISNTAAAASLGLARGLTFGLSDRAAVNAGWLSKEDIREWKQRNRVASVGGEVGGALLPLLLSGGTSAAGTAASVGSGAASAVRAAGTGVRALSRVGGAIEKGTSLALRSALGQRAAGSLVGRGVASGAASAVEGSVYAATQYLDETFLGEADYSAEQLMGRVGLGAMLGGATGAATRIVSAPLDVAAQKAMTRAQNWASKRFGVQSAKEVLEEVSEEAALKSTGVMLKHMRKLEKSGRLKIAGAWLRKNKIVRSGDSLDEIAEKIGQKAKESGDAISNFYQNIDDAAQIDDLISAQEIADRIEKQVLAPLKGNVGARNVANAVENEIDAFRQLGGDYRMSFREAVRQKNSYDPRLKWGAEPSPLQAELRKVRTIINDMIEERGDKLAGKHLQKGAFKAFKQAKEDFGIARMLQEASEDRVLRAFANRRISPSDYGASLSAAAGTLARGPDGLVESIGQAGLIGGTIGLVHRYARTKGNTWVAEMADHLSRSKHIMRLSQVQSEFNRSLDRGVSRAVTRMEKGERSVVSKATAPLSVRVLQGTTYGDVSSKLGDGRDDAFEKRVEELADLASNPDLLMARVTESMETLNRNAPAISAQLQGTATRAVQFLHAKAPKRPHPKGMIGGRKWRPSKRKIAQFSRYVAAVENPLSVVDDLERGHVSAEAAEALRTVYPRLHQTIVASLVEKLGTDPTKVPYSDRVSLSLLFGVPFDSTLQPRFVARIQQHYAQQPNEAQPQPGRGGGGVRLTGLEQLDGGEPLQTRSMVLKDGPRP